MFNDVIVVQSAVSAFNNAALMAPAFLWWAILAVPLFVLVYFCGAVATARLGWNRGNIMSRAAMVAVVLTLCWVVMFGGNYGVLRDAATVMPFMTAAILFLGTLFVGSHTRGMKLPPMRPWAKIAGGLVVLAAVGLSDMHAWWGPILQIAAFAGGFVAGRGGARHEMPPVAGTLMIIMMATTAMLMQPEFFRFGQLGSLTPAHLLFLLLIGVASAAVFALHNVNPRGRIHKSAFVKLKWMARFMAALGVALFFLTESVPIFLGTAAVFGCMFAMSVWHASDIPDGLAEKMFAIVIGLFGIVTVMPAMTAVAILYWIMLPQKNTWNAAKFLL